MGIFDVSTVEKTGSFICNVNVGDTVGVLEVIKVGELTVCVIIAGCRVGDIAVRFSNEVGYIASLMSRFSIPPERDVGLGSTGSPNEVGL